MTDPVRVFRYVVPNDNPGEGWAVVLMDSRGVFSAVSDWGNYGYWWSHHGCDDFRTFVAEHLPSDPEYFVKKVAPRREYDGEATRKRIEAMICRERRAGLVRGV